MAQQVSPPHVATPALLNHQAKCKIYFLRNEANNHIKIGFTDGEPEDRRRACQTGSSGKLTLLFHMSGTREDEKAWHDRFAYARIGGEWFRPDPQLLKAIEEAKASKAAAVRRAPAPFEEPFWSRYSRHHEFPLSAATSIALHVLAVVFMFILMWWLWHALTKSKLEVDTLEVTFAGGGGNPQGEGNAAGDRPPVGGAENVEAPKNEQVKPTGPLADLKKVPILDPLDVILDDQQKGRTINQANEAVQSLSKLSKDVRSKLFNNIGPSKGQSGPGRDGGRDTGKDTGKDKFTGPGTNKFNSRVQRVLRWVMRFNTLNGNDYRRQLAGLGAILAFPQPDGGYMVYRDINQKPVKGEVEDIASIKRIFWVDDKKDSIRSLAEAMDVPVPDGPIVAFFPLELEAELLRKELAYKGKKEEDIKETHFKINNRGGGKFVPEVVEQH
jgi:hypothetical protein